MHAANIGNKTIQVSHHLTNALDGFNGGYKVNMHALPDYTFIVDCTSGETAVKRVVELCARMNKHLSTDAATFQRRP
jgi:hypothetical protein